MSEGPFCPNLTQKVQREVSQMANRNFSRAMLLGGLSVNLNHQKNEGADLGIKVKVKVNGYPMLSFFYCI